MKIETEKVAEVEIKEEDIKQEIKLEIKDEPLSSFYDDDDDDNSGNLVIKEEDSEDDQPLVCQYC